MDYGGASAEPFPLRGCKAWEYGGGAMRAKEGELPAGSRVERRRDLRRTEAARMAAGPMLWLAGWPVLVCVRVYVCRRNVAGDGLNAGRMSVRRLPNKRLAMDPLKSVQVGPDRPGSLKGC